MTDDILLQVHKPSRYIGHEWNVSKKDLPSSRMKFALCFPDLYEVGMSNLGVRILYSLLNEQEGVCCERFFSVDMDMEALIRQDKFRLLSLESSAPLSSFDIIGFSLGHELCYTNVLNLLELGGLPLNSSLRGINHPLVIGGGPAAFNPEPLADFFDLFVIGEAEDAIIRIIDTCRRFKDSVQVAQANKRDLLIGLSQIEGVYVPALFDVEYDSSGRIKMFSANDSRVRPKVKKIYVKDFNISHFPVKWLVPYSQIVNDRITLELMRGCPNRCRFCQARQYYSPFRYRDPQVLLETASRAYACSGYEEISLGGLSVSDYPHIKDFVLQMVSCFKEKSVGISLPSIKPKDLVGDLSLLISTVKKTGLTFAPEAGTDRLREILGKDFDAQDLLRAVEDAYQLGWQHIKLYFMIGIPSETTSDLDSIISMANEMSMLRKKIGKGPAEVNLSINTIIPKPHTSFQWEGMLSLEEITQRQDYLKKNNKNRRIKIDFHNRYMSLIEAAFSRGDRRLGEVILSAFKMGARFDSWGNYFIFERWLEAFASAGLNLDFYLRSREFDEILPWDFIDTGVDRCFLVREARLVRGEQ